MATDGKWTCSTQEEHWDCTEEFNTRDEALAYAVSEHVPEMGLDHGDNLWVGQIQAVTLEPIVESLFDAESIEDRIACWLYDNVGEDFADDIAITKAQGEDLERRLAETFRAWATEHKVAPTCFTLARVEHHRWQQCDKARPVSDDDVGITSERCLLHAEHDGAHQWP
ncbi:MAG TPA: hypothetical protein VIV58_22600 [Kofleriaceae bacterium]